MLKQILKEFLHLQASKDYPQLAEHAARMKCQPSTEFGQFLRGVMQRETAPNYDNVIATSNWVEEEEDKSAKVCHFLCLTARSCSHESVTSSHIRDSSYSSVNFLQQDCLTIWAESSLCQQSPSNKRIVASLHPNMLLSSPSKLNCNKQHHMEVG